MRYMMLIYSQKQADVSPDAAKHDADRHRALIEETTRKGILVAAEPLPPTSATTVRVAEGRTLVTDGPFAETKELLAGYYILECENLDDAIEWAAKIPTACQGGDGCIEIRPMPGLPARMEDAVAAASTVNG